MFTVIVVYLLLLKLIVFDRLRNKCSHQHCLGHLSKYRISILLSAATDRRSQMWLK